MQKSMGHSPNQRNLNHAALSCRPRKGIPMRKETSKKSKLWIWIVAIALLLLAAGGGVLAFLMGQGGNDTPAADPVSGPRADLYWNLDREFYTKDSLTGLSTREADANGQFKIRFAYNGEIVELVIVDKKLVNVIDTQDVVGLQFDENGVVIGSINVRDLATEVGKRIYVKRTEEGMIYANSSMAMNGMELFLKLGQYSEIYDLREGSETFGKKVDHTAIQAMDCITVYGNADGENTHIYLLSSSIRSKVYWRAEQWYDSSNKKTSRIPDAEGVYTIDFYCEGKLVTFKTKDTESLRKIDSLGRHNAFTGLIFDENGYIVGTMDVAAGLPGMELFRYLDILSIDNGNFKFKNRFSTSGVQSWEGTLPEDMEIYDVSNWAFVEGVKGQKISTSELRVGDRLTVWADMDGKPAYALVTMRRVYDMKPMFNNSAKYDSATHTTTRTKDEDGYYSFRFISEKGVADYKTKDEALANYIDSWPERVFGIVTKGDKLIKAYDYECLFGYTRFGTALYVDSINGPILSASDNKKANTYNAVIADDLKVLDISGVSKEYGTKITLQEQDAMVAFRNENAEVCLVYVTKRSMGGNYYVNTNPDSERKPDADGNYVYEMTDLNGKKVTLKLPAGKKAADGTYAKQWLARRIDGMSKGVVGLKVSGSKITNAYSPANVASGNTVGTVIITKAGATEYEFKTAAKPNDEATIYPGWVGDAGVKKVNISGAYTSYKGEKYKAAMKVNDVYFVIRNRANDTIAMLLTSRVILDDLFFVKDAQSTSTKTFRQKNAEGYYTIDVMWKGEKARFYTKDEAMVVALDNKRTGAVVQFEKDAQKRNIIKSVSDPANSSRAYTSLVSNWDVTSVSGSNITVKLNVPAVGAEVGTTKKINISGAKIYNISPDAGDQFGKTTKVQKNDRLRVYTDRNGKVGMVLVTVRNGLKTELCSHCNKKVTWNPLTVTSGIGAGNAHYYIYQDNWNVYSQMSVANTSIDKYEVVVDLDGKTVTQVGNNTRIFQVVYPGKTLTILDSKGGGTLQGYGVAYPTKEDGTPKLKSSGAIDGGNGNVLQVAYGGTLNLLGGTYKMLEAADKVTPIQGGVIFSYTETKHGRNTINIKGGTIEGGNIVNPLQETDLEMLTHSTYGGSIYAYLTDIKMSGGTITGGTANRGGNLYLIEKSTFTMTGGEITGGTARNRGGNIYAGSDSTVTIKGGKVTNGTITGYEFESGKKIKGQHGGNIVASLLNVSGGEITGGTALASGGNIFMAGTDGKINVSGGKISGGSAVNGNNVYIYGNNGVLNLSGGEIIGNGNNNVLIAAETVTNEETKVTEVKSISTLNLTGGYIDGGVIVSKECKVLVSDNAKVGDKGNGLGMSAGSVMGIEKLSETAKLYINANGKFAKAAKAAVDLDITAYVGKQIVPDDKQLGNIYTEKDADGVLWLAMGKQENVGEVFGSIYEQAVKMTTDNVFASGEVVSAECPYCGETAQWAPLNATTIAALTLDDANCYVVDGSTHTHYYMAADVKMPAANDKATRLLISNGEICLHLNGKTIDQDSTASTEGLFKVSKGVTLNILGDGVVIGAGSTAEVSGVKQYTGGAIDARGTVNIVGGTYKSGHADRPAIGVWDGSAIVNLYAGKIVKGDNVDGVAGAGSSNVRLRTGTFNMYGGEISGGSAVQGGNVYVYAGTFNLKDGVIKDGVSNNLGGNIRVVGGTVNISGGQVLNGTSGGTATITGGSIGVGAGTDTITGKLNISGGVIDGGSGAANGGLIGNNGGAVNISGGELKNGVATGNGGNLYVMRGTATITGGTITGGKVGGAANDIYVASGKTAAVSGATIGYIKTSGTLELGNGVKTTVERSNKNAKLVLADDLSTGTEIKLVYAANDEAPLTEANENAAAYLENKYVVSANAARDLMVNADKQIYLASMETAIENLDALLDTVVPEGKTYHEAYCPVCGEFAQWVPVTKTTTTLDGGEHTHYYFDSDITREDGKCLITSEKSGSVTCIHLNGKTYDQGSATTTKSQGAITANAGTTVNIMGNGTVVGTGIQYPYAEPTLFGGGAIDVRGTVNIYGGTYKAANVGPAVALFAGNGATVNMYDGEILSNEAITDTSSVISSNVRMYDTSHKFNMYGGTITGGKAENGGNLRMQGGEFNMYGGTISGGTSKNLGGNICVRGGTFNMTGGEVLNGVTAASGGNFGLVTGTVNISGGTVSGGDGTQKANAVDGGLIYVYNGTLKITGGTFVNGKATNGGIFGVGDKHTGTVTISGGTFSGGTATAIGGIMHVASGTGKINVTGGTFTNGTAVTCNGINVSNNRTLTIGGNTGVVDVRMNGTAALAVNNGAKVNVDMVGTGLMTLADDLAEGTEIFVTATATKTIASHATKAAEYLTYFKTTVENATFSLATDSTTDIQIVIPVVEPAPEPTPTPAV